MFIKIYYNIIIIIIIIIIINRECAKVTFE